jgi:hypothetical protein
VLKFTGICLPVVGIMCHLSRMCMSGLKCLRVAGQVTNAECSGHPPTSTSDDRWEHSRAAVIVSDRTITIRDIAT